MKKIPVKIVEIKSPSGQKAVEVMLDVFDYYAMSGNVQKKIKDFRQKYFDTVKKAQDIMPRNRSDRKASHFWKVGKLLYNFNKSITNEFEITNYNQAVIRDFGLYNRSHVGHTMQFGEFFNEKDISDSIPMSTYLELIWKANILAERSLLEKEKKRLLEMSRNKSLPPHKEYRAELNKLTEYVQPKTKNKEKIIHKPKKSLVDYF